MEKNKYSLSSKEIDKLVTDGLNGLDLSVNNKITCKADIQTLDNSKNISADVKVMPASEKDIESILSIMKESSLWLKEKGINQWNPEKYLKKYDEKYFLNAVLNYEVFIITFGDHTIGAFLLKWKDEDIWKDDQNAGYLHHLTIKRNFSGKKLGEIAIENVKNIVKSNGKKYLRLDCKANNIKLNQYYISCGFKFKGGFKLGSYKGNKYEIEV